MIAPSLTLAAVAMPTSPPVEAQYFPRNRRLCLPLIRWTSVDGVEIYADDADIIRGKIEAIAWGMAGSAIRIVTHAGRFTLCDERGRFLKHAECRSGEGRRRVRTFGTLEKAARHLIRSKVVECV